MRRYDVIQHYTYYYEHDKYLFEWFPYLIVVTAYFNYLRSINFKDYLINNEIMNLITKLLSKIKRKLFLLAMFLGYEWPLYFFESWRRKSWSCFLLHQLLIFAHLFISKNNHLLLTWFFLYILGMSIPCVNNITAITNLTKR